MILQHERGLKAEGEIKIIQKIYRKRLQRMGSKTGKGIQKKKKKLLQIKQAQQGRI